MKALIWCSSTWPSTSPRIRTRICARAQLAAVALAGDEGARIEIVRCADGRRRRAAASSTATPRAIRPAQVETIRIPGANSRRTWRHAPHGGVGSAARVTITIRAPGCTAARQRAEERDPLGAEAQPQRGVLDVAAGDDPAFDRLQRGADREARVGRVRSRERRPGRRLELRLDLRPIPDSARLNPPSLPPRPPRPRRGRRRPAVLSARDARMLASAPWMHKSRTIGTACASFVPVLRAPGGCPWDRAQTIRTLTPYLLEETHELLDAIAAGEDGRIAEEIGDLLYLLISILTIAEEEGRFTLRRRRARRPREAGPASSPRLRRRRAPADRRRRADGQLGADQADRGRRPARRPTDAWPSGAERLPALLEAFRVQEKAAGFGFDWPEPTEVLAKLDEERRGAVRGDGGGGRGPDAAAVREELGDILFTVVNLARHLGEDPERALHGAVAKFRSRFGRMESLLEREGLDAGQGGPRRDGGGVGAGEGRRV